MRLQFVNIRAYAYRHTKCAHRHMRKSYECDGNDDDYDDDDYDDDNDDDDHEALPQL